MTNLPTPGTVVHALGAISLCGYALRRGDSLKLTRELVELTLDKHGNSFLSLADDEDAQVEKYGELKFGLGPVPSQAMDKGVPGGRPGARPSPYHRARHVRRNEEVRRASRDPGRVRRPPNISHHRGIQVITHD
jgi:hypothetical protein